MKGKANEESGERRERPRRGRLMNVVEWIVSLRKVSGANGMKRSEETVNRWAWVRDEIEEVVIEIGGVGCRTVRVLDEREQRLARRACAPRS